VCCVTGGEICFSQQFKPIWWPVLETADLPMNDVCCEMGLFKRVEASCFVSSTTMKSPTTSFLPIGKVVGLSVNPLHFETHLQPSYKQAFFRITRVFASAECDFVSGRPDGVKAL
jgi:hypothetical protein